MTTSVEVWKPVVGYEGLYEVSNQGRVRSVPRWSCKGKGRRWVQGGVLKPTTEKNGYQVVSIKGALHKVHRLVMNAFCAPAPDWSTMVNHIDGNPSNNQLANLEWSDNGHNKRHANRRYEYRGKMFCLTELSELTGVPVQRLFSRIVRLNWTVSRAAETPSRQ